MYSSNYSSNSSPKSLQQFGSMNYEYDRFVGCGIQNRLFTVSAETQEIASECMLIGGLTNGCPDKDRIHGLFVGLTETFWD
jgi:hypothetical protein